MKNKLISKQSIALFIAATISGITLNTWWNANAQTTPTKPTPPKYTKLQDVKNFSIKGNGKAFQPRNLQQTNQPDKADDQEFKRGVIGWDDRVPMLSRQYPWSAIGRVQGLTTKGEEYHCTGTLISEDVVLTNSHCVIDPETHQASQKILFLPNLINGKVADESDIDQVQNVIYGTDFTKTKLENQTDDWALLKLNKPIGLKYGYLGWKSLPSSTLTKNRNKYIFVGYSGDFPNTDKEKYRFFTAGKGWTASVQQGCSIVGEEGNVLLHDCDTTGGSSGGAIIGVIGNQPYIIGLNNAEYKTRDGKAIINLGVKIDFLDKLVGK
ncbi:trypsin-like serine peptidase [Brasilonema octagenarum]|uniref:Peptidase S1 n=1 Tax=Brasilonema octagenarum UFV-OR1 TaxID=417115 RepID=A0ABX1ML17_9CYAN|nr:trypsin-like serine protease [Brasilonema octagenarum]NMF66537.1 peptidase S1 [Brasilonema octagenarum UFV-OR1]